jgi:hypothetical protein
MSVIMSIRNAVWRTIYRRSPPAASVTVNRTIVIVRIISVISLRIRVPEPAGSVNKIHRPSMPWIVRHSESPGTWTRIVTSASPWTISPTGTVNNNFTHGIRRKITARISYVNYLRRRMIDIHITYIVHRRCRRNNIYLNRTPFADNPWSSRT